MILEIVLGKDEDASGCRGFHPSWPKVGSEEAKNEYVEVQIVIMARVSNGQLSVKSDR